MFWEKVKIPQWIIWVFLFMQTVLMSWISLNLMSNAWNKWNNFWCHTDAWVNFKESKDSFLCILFDKIEQNLENYHFLVLSMTINSYKFYTLIEFKTCSAPTCISIPFSNLGHVFQKILITYNLGKKTVETKYKIYF